MRLALSDADVSFRDELREFFTTQIPAEIRERARTESLRYPDDMVTTQRILNKAGLAVPTWPVEWGGKDWSPLQRQIWADEMPDIPLVQTPTLMLFNSTYWTNWPTADNNYIQPPNHWEHFLRQLVELQPAQ